MRPANPGGDVGKPRELKIVLPSALKPGSASPVCSIPSGVQFGPPSVTWVRSLPSGRILSMRTLKQPSMLWPTVNRIQSSLDQA